MARNRSGWRDLALCMTGDSVVRGWRTIVRTVLQSTGNKKTCMQVFSWAGPSFGCSVRIDIRFPNYYIPFTDREKMWSRDQGGQEIGVGNRSLSSLRRHFSQSRPATRSFLFSAGASKKVQAYFPHEEGAGIEGEKLKPAGGASISTHVRIAFFPPHIPLLSDTPARFQETREGGEGA